MATIIKTKSFLDTPKPKRKRWRPSTLDVVYALGAIAGASATLWVLHVTHHLK